MGGRLAEAQYSLRALARAPGFSLVVILTLALGIGGSTAIFTFVDGVLLRPLSFPDAGALIQVCETHAERPSDWCGAAPGNLWDWQQTTTLETVGLGRSWRFGLKSSDGRFEGVAGGVATVGLFEALGIRPHLGRLLRDSDHTTGGDRVAILSHALWQSRFAADPDVVDSWLQLDQDRYQIVGVLPAGIEVPYLESVELWIPLWSERTDWRHWRGLRSYGRLASGATLEQARTELTTLAQNLASQHPESNAGWSVRVDRLQDRMVSSVRQPLWVFLGAVGFVLLLACANAANLLLARSTVLQKEHALRIALGSSRSRLLRLLLTQSLILATAGGAIGLLLATVAVRLFVTLAPSGFPRLDEVGIDLRVFAFSMLVSLLTSVLFGLVPAWQTSRFDPHTLLKTGQADSAASLRSRGLLVVAELGLATVLLVGAGLLMQSYRNLTDWQPGFDIDGLVTFSVFPPGGKYESREQVATLYRQIDAELSALPGVATVGQVSAGPLFGGGDGVAEFTIEGHSEPPGSTLPTVAWFDTSPGYFSTLGVPLLRGRGFDRRDTHGAPHVAIVNETMARQHFGDDGAIGRRIRIHTHDITFEIVGVVADVEPFDPRGAVQPEIYWPIEQVTRWASFFAVRVQGDAAAAAPAIVERLEQLEPEMTVSSPTTLHQLIARQLVRPRFQMSLLLAFSIIAMAVATTGVYGVTAYSVSRRARELGIRKALGARRGDVLKLVLSHGWQMALLGLTTGLAGALALTRLLNSMLVEIGASDPVTLLAAIGILAAVALLATAIPAHRASGAQPFESLRQE